MTTTRSLPLYLVALGSLLLFRGAGAEDATPNQDFLDRSKPTLIALVDSLTAGVNSPEGTLAALRRILAERRRALIELNAVNPLTDLTGIETQDRYDLEVVSEVQRVLASQQTPPGPPPSVEQIAMFESALGNLPDLGKEALAFMVLVALEQTVNAADSLVAHRDMTLHEAATTAVGFAQTALDQAKFGQKDFLTESGRDDLRQSSVILRLRCPKDQGVYKLNDIKSRVADIGDISRIYYLQCSVCAEPRAISFPLELASRMSRLAVRQKQAHPATPRASYSLEP